ncbi:hypothetical protein BO83DRAFT_422546 [Aspergillus eucalypticola CBS 122712]|uniref:Uncharacterized protein n=1 Tax=Aspergillus eucalypticola (strain CBS 122712 / IBT 29274) TaxID=1448314 RepID=A0A317WK08_ASPEC|nr:uncharacterized protein BO83DRAFT_422546 [Aspergillus eucalypticola CBS 122712]PWY85612.1 hypothetical protein BO83DRAFT_422546 [Aspergillus eucalypticola CBS 122712]
MVVPESGNVWDVLALAGTGLASPPGGGTTAASEKSKGSSRMLKLPAETRPLSIDKGLVDAMPGRLDQDPAMDVTLLKP